jgi:hypothetical protein
MRISQNGALAGNAIVSAIALAFVTLGLEVVRADEGCCTYTPPEGGVATGCWAFIGGEGEGCNGTPYCCIPATYCHPITEDRCTVVQSGGQSSCYFIQDSSCDPT